MSETSKKIRRGKIARLSYETRERINAMLRDGASGPAIAAWLMNKHKVSVNQTNISNWRHGGYQDWLKQQAYLDQVRERAETMRRKIEADGGQGLDHSIFDVACTLADADISPEKAASALAALKVAVVSGQRIELDARKVDLSREKLELDRKRFNLKFAETFLKFYEDQNARSIAESDSSNDRKIQALLAYMEEQEAE